MKSYMSNGAKKQIKDVLRYLKVARLSDHLTYHAMIGGEKFKNAVLIPLEKLADWGREDEKEIRELATKLESETESKTTKERVEKLHKILKISGGIVAGTGILTGLAYFVKRNHKKNNKQQSRRE